MFQSRDGLIGGFGMRDGATIVSALESRTREIVWRGEETEPDPAGFDSPSPRSFNTVLGRIAAPMFVVAALAVKAAVVIGASLMPAANLASAPVAQAVSDNAPLPTNPINLSLTTAPQQARRIDDIRQAAMPARLRLNALDSNAVTAFGVKEGASTLAAGANSATPTVPSPCVSGLPEAAMQIAVLCLVTEFDDVHETADHCCRFEWTHQADAPDPSPLDQQTDSDACEGCR